MPLNQTLHEALVGFEGSPIHLLERFHVNVIDAIVSMIEFANVLSHWIVFDVHDNLQGYPEPLQNYGRAANAGEEVQNPELFLVRTLSLVKVLTRLDVGRVRQHDAVLCCDERMHKRFLLRSTILPFPGALTWQKLLVVELGFLPPGLGVLPPDGVVRQHPPLLRNLGATASHDRREVFVAEVLLGMTTALVVEEGIPALFVDAGIMAAVSHVEVFVQEGLRPPLAAADGAAYPARS